MNQISQENKLYIIPFFFSFFLFSLSRHLLLLDYLCYYYTCERGGGDKQTFHILPILIILYMTKILYTHNNKIFDVNNSQE